MKVAKDSSPGILSSRCCSTTEICGTGTGSFTAHSPGLGKEQQTGVSHSLGGLSELHAKQCFSSPTRIFDHCFQCIQRCNLPPAKPFSFFLCINRGGDPFCLGDTLRGWAHLSAPSYLCSQLPILLSMTKNTLQAALSGNTFQCPTANERWGNCPSPRPFQPLTGVSFGVQPTELQGPGSGGTV